MFLVAKLSAAKLVSVFDKVSESYVCIIIFKSFQIFSSPAAFKLQCFYLT